MGEIEITHEYRLLKNIFIVVFVLYSIFFLLFVSILLAPSFSGQFYLVLGVIWYFYPILVFPLLIIVGLVIGCIIEGMPFDRKYLRKILLLTLLVIVIFVLNYFLLDWLIPTFSPYYSG